MLNIYYALSIWQNLDKEQDGPLFYNYKTHEEMLFMLRVFDSRFFFLSYGIFQDA